MVRMIIIALALVFAVTAPAFAQTRRVALVIGISNYQNAQALPNPLNDAVDMAAAFQAAGFEVVAAYDPDYAAMHRALRDFGRALEGAGIGAVYYAGHGVQVDGQNYLLPRDVQLADDSAVEREAINMNQVLALLADQPRVGLVFLDACRDNPLGASLARRAGAARRAAVVQGLAQVQATAANTLIAYATQPGAVAADGAGRNSPFTSALLRHMGAPGLDVQDVMRRVRASVMQATKGLQVPWENSSLTQSFAFVTAPTGKVPPSAAAWVPPRRDPTPTQLDLALWNDVKDRSPGEIQSYLNRYPTGIFADTARARLAALNQAASQRRDDASRMAADIAKEFAALAGRGALVDAPKEPHEFYANARLYELRGDFLNARSAYLGFMSFGLPRVDPHYRFQSFLRVQEGRAGAREVYAEMANARRGDETLAYAAALLLAPEQRKTRLNDIIRARPDFAPAYYELARSFSRDQLGTQTAGDQEREYELLVQFIALHEQGRLVRWFIDQSVVADLLDDARRRIAAFRASAGQRQVTFESSRSNQGWTIAASIVDAVQEIFVEGPSLARRSTGFMPSQDARTGKPMAQPFFSLPSDARAGVYEMTYRDNNGQLRGPYRYAFDPEMETARNARRMLELTTSTWLSLRNFDGRRLLYFTAVYVGRCAIQEFRYGIDTMNPDRLLPMGACNLRDPYARGEGDTAYMDAPPGTRFVSAQIVFKDGTRSEVFRYGVQ